MEHNANRELLVIRKKNPWEERKMRKQTKWEEHGAGRGEKRVRGSDGEELR